MGNTIGRKLGWFFCGAGFLLAVSGMFVLPDMIPFSFNSGGISKYAGKETVFLSPLLQFLVMWLGGRKNLLPESLRSLLSESQYNWALCGITTFLLLFETLVIWSALVR